MRRVVMQLNVIMRRLVQKGLFYVDDVEDYVVIAEVVEREPEEGKHRKDLHEREADVKPQLR